MSLADRLRARGVDNPGSFLAWAIGAGHHGPLDGIFDRDLGRRLHELAERYGP